jgi:hypothetical protein
MRFDRASDAAVFDQHLVDFLKYCEGREEIAGACLFSYSQMDAHIHIRVVQTDNPRMLGRLLNFLNVRNFPEAIRRPAVGKITEDIGASAR